MQIKDKSYFIRKSCKLTNIELSLFYIGCALVVLPIFEAKYPDNKAPREAIQAAKDYLAGTIDIDELIKKRNAAAINTNDSVYDAAYSAYYAAYHAGYPNEAESAYIAYAAYAAEPDPKYKNLLLQFFKDYIELVK